ncbi:MAG: hypothetical protein HY042_06555, partial [Spirochaetia bacterium]|nr:hypothetical protein [Spirochaetia bacterium]
MGLRPQLFFDARMIGHSGIGTQVENVLSRLLARDETNLTILGNSGKVKTILGDVRVPVVEWDAPIYSIQEQLQYPAIPPGALLHFPHYNAPVTRMQQSVVVLHDLIHLQSAEFNRIQKVYCRFFLGRLARNARSVVTVSDATRNEFLKLHPGAAGRTETILN